MSELDGHCDPAFRTVRDTFAEHFERHPAGGPPELGASVSVVVRGRTVVDLWGGFADRARTRSWQRDSLCMVASCTKGLTALAVQQRVEAGQLDVEAPVARYWPEHAQNGKQATLVRHFLTHQAGQPTLDADLGPGGVWDWPRVTRAFAAAPPLWEPGSALGYHAFSFGHLVGEVVRRVSGRSVGELLRSQVATPLGVEPCLGVNDDELARCVEFVAPPSGPFAAIGGAGEGADFAAVSRYSDPRLLSAAAANSLVWRRAGWPAAGTFTNARALARVYGALANGGELDGVRLLRRDTLEQATREYARGRDSTLGNEAAFALGWQKSLPGGFLPSGAKGFGHAGGWGSLGWADPDCGLGFGYTLNQTFALLGDPRATRLYAAALACL
jgi:CubicO group peptidase (beta-lactamase class C family)